MEWRNLITGEKLYWSVTGETRTQVFADSMTIAASMLNHCVTWIYLLKVMTLLYQNVYEKIVTHSDTDISIGGSIGEWRNLITGETPTSHRWDSNPGTCR